MDCVERENLEFERKILTLLKAKCESLAKELPCQIDEAGFLETQEIAGLPFEIEYFKIPKEDLPSEEKEHISIGFWHIFHSVEYHCKRCLACKAEFGAEIYKEQVFKQIVLEESKRLGEELELEDISDGWGELRCQVGSVAIVNGKVDQQSLEATAKSISTLKRAYMLAEERFKQFCKEFDEFRNKHELKHLKYSKPAGTPNRNDSTKTTPIRIKRSREH